MYPSLYIDYFGTDHLNESEEEFEEEELEEKELEEQEIDGTLEKLSKKEYSGVSKELDKLKK